MPKAEQGTLHPSTAGGRQQADGVRALTHGLKLGVGTEPKLGLAHPARTWRG